MFTGERRRYRPPVRNRSRRSGAALLGWGVGLAVGMVAAVCLARLFTLAGN